MGFWFMLFCNFYLLKSYLITLILLSCRGFKVKIMPWIKRLAGDANYTGLWLNNTLTPITLSSRVHVPLVLTLYQKSALWPSKWPPNDPKFRDFSYFCMTYLKSKKQFFGFSKWFWVFRRGGWRTPPPPPLNVYFQPRPK